MPSEWDREKRRKGVETRYGQRGRSGNASAEGFQRGMDESAVACERLRHMAAVSADRRLVTATTDEVISLSGEKKKEL